MLPVQSWRKKQLHTIIALLNKTFNPRILSTDWPCQNNMLCKLTKWTSVDWKSQASNLIVELYTTFIAFTKHHAATMKVFGLNEKKVLIQSIHINHARHNSKICQKWCSKKNKDIWPSNVKLHEKNLWFWTKKILTMIHISCFLVLSLPIFEIFSASLLL